MKAIYTSFICLLLTAMFSADSNALNDALKIKIAGGGYSDETVIRFVAGATTGFDGSYDAWKLFSFNPAVPNLFSKTINADDVAINAFPPMSNSYTVNMFVKIGTAATYSVSSEEMGAFAPGTTIIMYDIATGQSYDLRSANINSIYFPVTSASDPARFNVAFTFQTILPIGLTGFSAQAEKNNVLLKWSTATEENNDYFTVERATGVDGGGSGLEFISIGTVQGAGNSSTIRSYEFDDTDFPSQNSILNTQIYYRLKQTDFNGNYKYFGPVSVSIGNTPSGINVYPSVSNGEITISGLQSAVYSLEVYNILGNIAYHTIVNNKQETITLNVPGGIYLLNVQTANEKFTQKIFIAN